jgi:sigma-B regulation protein RsbU (phosphoserine phosphatase)
LTASQWKELEVEANLAETDRIRRFLREMLHGMSFAEEELMKLELALHEVFVNIVSHAFPDGDGHITIRFRHENDVFYVEVRDRGTPFNPDKVPPLDLDKKLRSGTAGGFGIYLFKTLADGYSYRRDGNENVLTLFKRIPRVERI